MSNPNEPHYGLRVERVDVLIECKDHSFIYTGPRNGPTLCPECGRRFILSYNFNVEPAAPGYRSPLDKPE